MVTDCHATSQVSSCQMLKFGAWVTPKCPSPACPVDRHCPGESSLNFQETTMSYLSTCIQKPRLSARTAPDLCCDHSPLAVLLSANFLPPLPRSFHDRTSKSYKVLLVPLQWWICIAVPKNTTENNLQEEN